MWEGDPAHESAHAPATLLLEGLSGAEAPPDEGMSVVPSNPPPQRLTERHRLIAYAVIAGKTNVEIARALGYHINRIYAIRQSPLFRALVEQLRKELQAGTIGTVIDRIMNEAGPSVDAIVQLRDSAESESVKLAAAQDLLNRNPSTAKISRTEEDRTVRVLFDSNDMRRMAAVIAEDEGRDAIPAVATVVPDSPLRPRTLDEVLAAFNDE